MSVDPSGPADAGTGSDKRPDPTLAELAHKAAAVSYVAAKEALDGPVDEKTGAKIAALKQAAQIFHETAIAWVKEIIG